VFVPTRLTNLGSPALSDLLQDIHSFLLAVAFCWPLKLQHLIVRSRLLAMSLSTLNKVGSAAPHFASEWEQPLRMLYNLALGPDVNFESFGPVAQQALCSQSPASPSNHDIFCVRQHIGRCTRFLILTMLSRRSDLRNPAHGMPVRLCVQVDTNEHLPGRG